MAFIMPCVSLCVCVCECGLLVGTRNYTSTHGVDSGTVDSDEREPQKYGNHIYIACRAAVLKLFSVPVLGCVFVCVFLHLIEYVRSRCRLCWARN